jgi:glycosyltransferase involved in cell wall biosynthesis
MKVLIGITTHNRASILSKAIQSALDQDYPNKEVAVFNDASTDETGKLRGEHPDVSWHEASENQGLLRARNFLMQQTNADYYFSLDDDAWFLGTDEISAGVEYLNQNPRVAALAYDILSPDQPSLGPRTAARKTHSIIGCGHMLRLSAVREIGYYVPSPGMYGSEEQDLCIRLLDRKHDIMLLPGVHVWHDRTVIARDNATQHASAVCNDLVFAFRRSPYPMLLWLIPGKVISHLSFAIKHHSLKACLQGIGRFANELPGLLSTRQPVRTSVYKEFRRRLHSTQ